MPGCSELFMAQRFLAAPVGFNMIRIIINAGSVNYRVSRTSPARPGYVRIVLRHYQSGKFLLTILALLRRVGQSVVTNGT